MWVEETSGNTCDTAVALLSLCALLSGSLKSEQEDPTHRHSILQFSTMFGGQGAYLSSLVLFSLLLWLGLDTMLFLTAVFLKLGSRGFGSKPLVVQSPLIREPTLHHSRPYAAFPAIPYRSPCVPGSPSCADTLYTNYTRNANYSITLFSRLIRLFYRLACNTRFTNGELAKYFSSKKELVAKM